MASPWCWARRWWSRLRILLNSRTREFPQGLGNSSGTLGKYLMEHVAFNQMSGFFPELAGPSHPRMTMARAQTAFTFRATTTARRATNFCEDIASRWTPAAAWVRDRVQRFRVLALLTRKEIKELYPAAVHITGYGEGLPLEIQLRGDRSRRIDGSLRNSTSALSYQRRI